MSKHSKQTTNKIIHALDLPKDLFMGYPNICLSGNREIYISNHRGILSYGETEMIILVKDYQLQIRGKSMCIASYSKEELTIQGYIRSVEFI